MSLLKKYILEQVAAHRLQEKEALPLLKELSSATVNTRQDIAIIGMACRFPGASSLEEYWNNLQQGHDSIGDIPAARRPDVERVAREFFNGTDFKYERMGYLDHVDLFDHAFFEISPAEARTMDPYQRMFLELAWETFEHAGYSEKMISGSPTGVFLGYCDNESQYQRVLKNVDSSSLAGNVAAIIASRISYLLNLSGPSQLINTSCSSSLVALHQACQAIGNNDCRMALVGGVNLSLFPIQQDTDFGIVSVDRKTKAFDDFADGTVWGEGLGAVLLKSYDQAVKDNDYIHAVIKSTAVNCDGRSTSITAPNAISQSALLRTTWERARINPESISYIEAHGTGTRLGDPVEIEGIMHAFQKVSKRKQFCAIGSVKSNIGHTIAASGVAGIIKAALMMKHRQIPPTLHVKRPNTLIPFIDSPVYINDVLKTWDVEVDQPVRRAGVSAFGLSGTNAHVILEEPPKREATSVSDSSDYLITLSAKTSESLWDLLEKYQAFLSAPSEHSLLDICATANMGRGHYRHRLAFLINSKEDFLHKIHRLCAGERMEDGAPLVDGNQVFYGVLNSRGESSLPISMQIDSSNPVEMAKQYVRGVTINWLEYYRPVKWKKVPLPTYSFAKNRHWVQSDQPANDTVERSATVASEAAHENETADVHKIASTFFTFGETLLNQVNVQKQTGLEEDETFYSGLSSLECFNQLGVFHKQVQTYSLEELREAVGLDESNEHLFQLMLGLVVQAALVEQVAGTYRLAAQAEGLDAETFYQDCLDRYPNERDTFTQLKACFAHYSTIMTGQTVLVSNSTSDLFKSYADRLTLGKPSGLMAVETIAQYIHSFDRPVRILELGGGSSSLTRLLLPKIEKQDVTYLFTDCTQLSLVEAEKEFQEVYPFVQFRPFNMEQAPAEQGFDLHAYDVIIANNAIHKVRDVRASLSILHQLLAEQGVLFAIELVKNRSTANVIGGLAADWWQHEDTDLRQQARLMDASRWEKALRDTNYQSVAIYPSSTALLDLSDSALLIGRSAYTPQEYREWLYQINWQTKELSTNHQTQRPGIWLVFQDEGGVGETLADAMSSEGHEVFRLRSGEAFTSVSSHEFILDPTQPADLRRVFERLGDKKEKLTGIIHLWSLTSGALKLSDLGQLEDLESAQYLGVYSLFHLTQVLLELDLKQVLDLRIVSNYAQAVDENGPVYPEKAPLFGLAKVISQENPKLQCFSLDLATEGLSTSQLAGQLLAEIRCNRDDTLVAYRGNRSVPEMNRCAIDKISKRPVEIRENGVYLIAGGTGKLGLAFSKHLAAQKNVTLVLINRSPLPPNHEWQERLQHPDCSTAEARKLKALLELEEMGAQVVCYAADVSDRQQMEDISEEVRARYGPINGIIQSAAHITFETIQTKRFSDFQNGLKAKMAGTVILDQIAEPEHLDFFVIFSSLASIWGGATGSDYVSSNCFLDAYSAARNRTGKPTIALNWYAFEGITGPGFIGYMPMDGAIQAFDASLSCQTEHLIIGQFDLQVLKEWAPSLKVKLGDTIFASVKTHKEREAPSAVTMQNRVVLSGREEGDRYTLWEQALGQIWSDVLGYTELSIDDDFFRLGGDSLLAIGIVSRVSKQMQREITITDLFQTPTIRQLAVLMAPNEETSVSAIPVAELREAYPATSSQQRIYVLEQMQEGAVAYNIPTIMLLEGELDREAFERAFVSLVQRHESLRTSFSIVDGDLMQTIQPSVDFTLAYSEVDENEAKRTVEQFIQPFDLSKAPLVRGMLIRIDVNKHLLLFDMHHIISDGVSINILIREFFQLYQGLELPELRIQYKDYSVWQSEQLGNGVLAAQEKFWLKELDGELPVLNLPTDHPRPSVQSFEGDVLTFEIPQERTEKILALAKNNGSTLYMTLLGALTIMLSKYAGEEDIIIGSPVAGRHHADLENIVGVFLNTLAMRNFPRSDRTVADFLQEVKERALAALSHADYSFEMLVDRLTLPKDTARNPLFDVMFILQNTGDAKGSMSANGLTLSPYPFEQRSAQFDLTFDIIEREQRLIVDIEYSNKLFSKETIASMSTHFQKILEQMVEDSEQLIGKMSMLAAEERLLLIEQWNDTSLEYSREKTVVQLFEEVAVKQPNALAVTCGDEKVTYAELNKRANQVARLIKQHDVTADTCVGLLTNRSVEMMVGLLAILKAGAAFVPIDPHYPEERISYVLENSMTRLVLTHDSLAEKQWGSVVRVDVNDTRMEMEDDSNLPPQATPSDLAYVIYTSGSTGKPKGVMVEHGNLMSFCSGIGEHIDFASADKMLAVTTISFDIFLLETIVPLAKGMTVVIATEQQQADPQVLKELILQEEITFLQLTPSRLQLMLEEKSNSHALDCLKAILLGGEALSASLFQRLRTQTKARLYNLYGPTETTIWSTVQDLTEAEEVTIGAPLPNTQVYILDEHLQVQPTKITGDLYIAGDGVTRGYFGQPTLTDERYIPNPFKPGQRMYKTGDLARWMPDGRVEYVGRSDFQCKVRGYRIELGEIESALCQHPDITEAVVSVRDTASNPYLSAYYMAERTLDSDELRAMLSKSLPDYMIPHFYTHMSMWPLTPNGKLDRKSLPEPDSLQDKHTEYQAPATRLEEQVAGIWREVLKRETVGMQDNFFQIGGTSLLLVQVHAKLEQLYPGRVRIADLFAHPTLSSLTNFLKNAALDIADEQEETDTTTYWLKELDRVSLIELPAQYWTNGEANADTNWVQFSLTDDLFENVQQVSQMEAVEVRDVLLSMYVYLMAELTGQQDLYMEVAVAKELQMNAYPFRVNMSEVNTFFDLFKQVQQKRQFIEKMTGEASLWLKKLRTDRNDGTIIPFFGSVNEFTDASFTHHEHELTFWIKEGKDVIDIVCAFNPDCLRAEKVTEMTQDYQQLLRMLVNEYMT
ncbi:edeine biosynthesis hybrid PKS-NRPS EdeI [Brevibacillus sp. BC25]|uniref:edeine biosynthesis hybrid PKS-NRPS EdeI n=1 Tax=Brevibacillus sp. BC25 TaxID=1144308 RepID=UPI000270E61D|nr:edeine biosynthesis hybrid PKS-NRPS EdeI [Brevibacillus sp. BC25]EJL22783.1 amino acid adenylation enzyme/thioester reductase family protein [Brevibacillus sp. BC25]